MLGAQALIRTLVASQVDVCFMNPGTSEMHFVQALDAVPEMRSVLTLFEGVATGAADGYARMTGRPAAVLLHLGPGFGNGWANLHNARRARSPIVTIVGAHATYHELLDAPLQSDIAGLARTVSGWFRSSAHPRDLGRDTADAIAAARRQPGQIATLVLPADVSWSEGAQPEQAARPVAPLLPVAESTVARVADLVTEGGPSTLLLLGGAATQERGIRATSRISEATGARALAETFPARQRRGAGLPLLEKLAYRGEVAIGQLDGVKHIVLAGARAPVTFFAYAGRPSDLVPEGCQVHTLATGDDDIAGALEMLADRLGPAVAPVGAPSAPPEVPTGALDAMTLAAAVGATLPENAVVVEEALTSAIGLPAATAGAPPHDWIAVTGGSIGQAMPSAVGVAIGAPDRPVLCLEADGSSLYTHQALWTMARENLNVTTVLLNNQSYAILRQELRRLGGEVAGPRAAAMIDLTGPPIDHATIARGFGVDACQARTADELVRALRRAYQEPGPHLIEAFIPPVD